MSSKKYSSAYADSKGTDAYWRDPKSPFAAQNAANKLADKQRTRKVTKKKGSDAPSAMQIYESWMEPSWGGTTTIIQAAPEQPKKEPPPSDTDDKGKNNNGYRYFKDYSDKVEDDPEAKKDPWADRKQHDYKKENGRASSTARRPKSASRPMEAKEDPDEEPTPPKPKTPPVRSPSPPPNDDEDRDFLGWVRNGRDDDMKRSKELLFGKPKKK